MSQIAYDLFIARNALASAIARGVDPISVDTLRRQAMYIATAIIMVGVLPQR